MHRKRLDGHGFLNFGKKLLHFYELWHSETLAYRLRSQFCWEKKKKKKLYTHKSCIYSYFSIPRLKCLIASSFVTFQKFSSKFPWLLGGSTSRVEIDNTALTLQQRLYNLQKLQKRNTKKHTSYSKHIEGRWHFVCVHMLLSVWSCV